MAGKVVSKGSTLNEEVINVLNYWFGTSYWNMQVTKLRASRRRLSIYLI